MSEVEQAERPAASGTATSPGTMQAAVFAGPKQIRIEERALPEPGPGQVRVRLEGCGVCGSNLPVWEGRPWFHYPLEPGAPGHEGWGRVEALGEGVEGVDVGDRVAAFSLHAYATHDVAAADRVVKLPPELDGVPFPGEPLGCAMNVFRRSAIERGQTVAVVGIGFMGALLTGLAVQAGARMFAVSRRPFALDVARRLGAEEAFSLESSGAAIEAIRARTGGAGCDRVIEAIGLQAPLDLAAELTKVRGRLIIAGYHQDGLRQVNMQLWNWRGLDVINAHERDEAVYVHGMGEAVEAAQQGRLDPTSLYTHTFDLSEIGEALRTSAERPDGFMKALVRMPTYD